MIFTPSPNGGPALVALSAREADMLRLVQRGKRPAEIADETGLTERTVRQYILLLCRGVSVRGMRELMLWGIQNPGASAGKAVRAGLHPSGCGCGSAACAGIAIDQAA